MASPSSSKSSSIKSSSTISASTKKQSSATQTQRILTSIALSRPVPYGHIPLRRPSAALLSARSDIHSPNDVNLSGIEGFDYDETWGLNEPSISSIGLSARKRGKARVDGESVKSSSLPYEGEEGNVASVSRSTLSRSSTTSTRSSSRKARRPRLLQQSFSPPVPSPQLACALGRASISARGSKSLADQGENSALPTLYHVSRGRSTNVSPSRGYGERRGTSASVLSGASGSGSGEDKVGSKVKKEWARKKSTKDTRKNSMSSLDTPLFSSEDGLSSSEDEDEVKVSSHSVSRRSSTEKDRRRGLKVLLAPSDPCLEFTEEPFSYAVEASDDRASSMKRYGRTEDSRRMSSCSDPKEGVFELSDEIDVEGDIPAKKVADDETEEANETSALLKRRRSHSGKHLLRSSLRSPSSSNQKAIATLEVILAGLTPDDQSDFQLGTAVKKPVPVDRDADPLFGSAVASVSEMIEVDAVEWNDQLNSSNISQSSSSISLTKHRRQSVAEQEKERRVGFAAAYQQRLSALLWSRDRALEKKINASKGEEKTDGEESESLLTSGWRHLTTLPNFLLMPTLGPLRMKNVAKEEANRETRREEALMAAQKDAAGAIQTSPTSGKSSAQSHTKSESSNKSSNSVADSPFIGPRGRGVMNPLQGDSDVSAYVPGLGLPIDPDLELSSVVHLQTFRTTQSSQSRSRRGSLEKPTSVDAAFHRRSYSDNFASKSSLVGATQDDEPFDAGRCPSFASRVPDLATPVPSESGSPPLQTKGHRDREKRPPRTCSRPAVPAHVAGDYSAYQSSESDEERERVESRGRKSDGRGRDKKSRLRSSSPPSNRRHQVAVGLFHGKEHARSHEKRGTHEHVIVRNDPVHVSRVKSTPNLPSLAGRGEMSDRQGVHAIRGRVGAVKVVSASYTGEAASEEEDRGELAKKRGMLNNKTSTRKHLSKSSSPAFHRSALGLGVPGSKATVGSTRPSMVSNGAHLLMLSLELEMMRNRKITCSLKPRWLKARIRSESSVRSNETTDPSLLCTGVAAVRKGSSHWSFPSTPRQGSLLRFEVLAAAAAAAATQSEDRREVAEGL
ncbi:hypothetical protein CBS101457_000372 [Exobasidium rhododendri]|nr:hypothetical protein CBS101457_000372 [Exobasidium rhododendri]